MNTIGRACATLAALPRRRLLLLRCCLTVLGLHAGFTSPALATEDVWTVFIAAGSGGTPGAIQGMGAESWAATRTATGVMDDPLLKDGLDGTLVPPFVAPMAAAEWYRPWNANGSYGFYTRDVRRPLTTVPELTKRWDDLIIWADNGYGSYTGDVIRLFISGAGVPVTVGGMPVVYKLILTHAPAGYTGPTEWTLPPYPYPDETSKQPWYEITLPSAGATTDHPIEGTGALTAVQVAGYRMSFVAQVALQNSATFITSGPLSGSISASRAATFTFQGYGPLEPLGYLQYQIQLDGAGWSAPGTDRSVTFTNLADGQHTFSVRVIDGTGAPDPTPPVVFWTVDATPPTLSITSGPAEGSHIQSGSVTFGFDGQDNLTPPAELVLFYLMDSSSWISAGAARTATFQGLSAGFHQFALKTADAAGNQAVTYRKFYVDLLPPTLTITEGPADGGLSAPTGTFTFLGADDVTPVELLRYQTKLDDGEWSAETTETSFQFQDLSNGEHTFSVRAVDLSGRVSLVPRVVTWTVSDGTEIVTSIIGGPADGSYVSINSAVFTFSGLGVAPVKFQTKLNNGEWTTPSSATAMTYTGLANGLHVFYVRTVDATGAVDTSPAMRSWYVDTVNPGISILSGPAAESWVNTQQVTFTLAGTDNLTPADSMRFEGRIGTGSWKPGDSSTSYTFTSLPQGTPQLSLRSLDLAGNYSSVALRTLHVDLTPPMTSFTVMPAYQATTGSIAYVATDNMAPYAELQFQRRLDEGTWSDWTKSTVFGFVNMPEGQHRFEVRAKDLAGNIEAAKAYEFKVDLTPPSTTITGGPAEGSHVKAVRATFEFTSSDNMSSPANTFYDRRIDGGAWVRIATAGATSYTTSTLSAGVHTFSVRATDLAGNTDPNPPVRTWTIDYTPPSTAITGGPADGSFQATGTGAFTFTGTDNLTPAGSLFYRTKLDDGAWSDPGSDATFSFAGLAPGAHTFSVVAVDLAGNEDASPAVRHWTVDLAPPAGLTVTDDGATTTDITKLHASWSVSAGPSGVAEYQFAIGTEPVDPGAGYLVSWTSAGMATEVTRAALPLKVGTTYYFYVRARSGAGLWSDVAASDGILVESPPFETVGQTKRLPNSLTGTLRGVIVVAGPSSFYEGIYVEAPDRSAGLKVATTEAVQEGDVVDVTGKLITSLTGEKAIQATEVKITGQTVPLLPLSMKLLSAAGRNADFNASTGAGQRGVSDPPGWGTNCSGMLVKVCGWVGDADFSTATIQVNDGSWPDLLGARVDGVTALSGVHLNSLVTVTGVVGMRRAGLSYQLVIHTRKAEDLQIDLLDPPLEMIRRLQWLGGLGL